MTSKRPSEETRKTGREGEEKKGNPAKFGLKCQSKSSNRYNEFSELIFLRYEGNSQTLESCLCEVLSQICIFKCVINIVLVSC